MKRNLLALAIPALLVAGAANASIEIWNKDGNKLDVNGRVKAANNITVGSNSKVLANQKKGDDTLARLGFTGETQITDSLSGYGRAEWETKAAGGGVDTRYAFAGFNFGQAGALDYGKNDGVQKAITAYTDVLPQFGGDASDNGLYVLSARSKSVLTYRNSQLLDGFSFALQYADRSATGDEVVAEATAPVIKPGDKGKHAYGLNAQYEILDTGLTVGASYAATEKYAAGTAGDKRESSYMAGIKYDANNLYLAAIYAYDKHGDDKLRGYELVGQYGIDLDVGRITPSLAYVQHKYKDKTGVNKFPQKYIEVGANYEFNKNMSAFADYKINLKRDGVKVKDVLGVGVIYQF